MKIFDAHLHAVLGDQTTVAAQTRVLLDRLARRNISQSCLMLQGASLGSGRMLADRADQYAQAELLNQVGREHAGVLFPMIWLNPALGHAFLTDLIDRFIVQGFCTGVKLSIQATARDPRVLELAQYLQERNIPVLFHCWHKTVERFAYESDPDDLAYLARRFPRLRILAAHMTGCRVRGIVTFRGCPNIWLDTSGSQPEDGYLELALTQLGPDRVLFGSDHPGRDLAVQLARIDALPLDAPTRAKLLYRNAQAFFVKGDPS